MIGLTDLTAMYEFDTTWLSTVYVYIPTILYILISVPTLYAIPLEFNSFNLIKHTPDLVFWSNPFSWNGHILFESQWKLRIQVIEFFIHFLSINVIIMTPKFYWVWIFEKGMMPRQLSARKLVLCSHYTQLHIVTMYCVSTRSIWWSSIS